MTLLCLPWREHQSDLNGTNGYRFHPVTFKLSFSSGRWTDWSMPQIWYQRHFLGPGDPERPCSEHSYHVGCPLMLHNTPHNAHTRCKKWKMTCCHGYTKARYKEWILLMCNTMAQEMSLWWSRFRSVIKEQQIFVHRMLPLDLWRTVPHNAFS